MINKIYIGLAIGCCCAFPSLYAATIRVDEASIIVNGTSTLNIYISGDGSEALGLFGFRLGITPGGGVTSTLSFVPDTGYGNVGDYVFSGNSGGITQSFLLAPAIDIQDSTNDATDVTLTASERLLARVGLQHSVVGDPASAVGDAFSIGLLDTNDSNVTFLTDSAFANDLAFTSNSGNVIAAAVPEPSSLALLGLSGVALLAARWRRRRRVAGRSESKEVRLKHG